jgi:hypothetical protein
MEQEGEVGVKWPPAWELAQLCREDFMCSVDAVIFGVCNSMRLLYLIVVTIRKWSVSRIYNRKPCRESL